MKYLNIILLFIALTVHSINVSAQQEAPPQGINYQAVVYSNNGNENPGLDVPGQILMNQEIGVRFTILFSSETGTEVYKETNKVTTDNFGLFTLIIGQGSQTSVSPFDSIDWGAGYHFLKVEIDKTGGSNYEDMGTQKMWSVPYALYTKYAEIAGNGISDVIDNGDGTITFNYFDGSSYTTGDLGGIPGPQGPAGTDGIDGLSAYEIWIAQGNVGTETDFFNSLIGPQGADGVDGLDGADGADGVDGADGAGITSVSSTTDSLTIYFSNGTYTTIVIATSGAAPGCVQIGDYHAGGIVFQVDSTCIHGLVVTAYDLNNYGFNTSYYDAISVCNSVKANGYTDWYLPDLLELNSVYTNLGNAGFRLDEWTGSTDPYVRYYWSSTQNPPAGGAWAINFEDGFQQVKSLNNDLRIRAIRAF
jgi:hypothetical protein